MAGSKLKEIRLPINNESIAGYAANNKKMVNISDAYDSEELRSIDPKIAFDSSWDQKLGIRTTQVLAAPILHENSLMGVMQLLNTKDEAEFTVDSQDHIEDIADVLGIALHNQQKRAGKKKTRFDYLVSQGLIKEEYLESAWGEARKSKVTIENLLLSKYKISKKEIGKSLEDFYRCKFIPFSDRHPVPGDLLKNLRKEYLYRELWVPLGKTEGKIKVLVDDPNNILKRDTIENLLKTKLVEYNVAIKEDILKFIDHFFQSQRSDTSIGDILGMLEDEDETPEEEGEGVVTESDSVIMQLVNKIINDAYLRNASDIHIEPNMERKNVEVRFRVDGDCMLYQRVPYSYRSAIISRIKIMSNLDITERRLPQDGKIKFRRREGGEIELRVASIPTQGKQEDVVMRLLPKGETMPLEKMNMSPSNYRNFVKTIRKPYGMVLVVGPTGSGKTTTLHAALHHINTPEKKIWTAEDPVEITQYGLRQVQINPKIGLDFSDAMRSFLRADPDVIMVGEMRDFETAKIGVEASLTGHLVFSTLHTNSAPETIVRLLDMGIDPLNFADSLLCILAQRLLKTLCSSCKEQYHPSKEEYDELARGYREESFSKLNIPYSDDFMLYRPKGCSECNNTGYRGRMAIHELLIATDEIKRLIQRHETVEAMRTTAISEGMVTLLQDGLLKAINGATDFKQVYRVSMR
jgi:type II secretory ATPase GspE/PulE/Tfp pilus assembly ATPase PilB-like protein